MKTMIALASAYVASMIGMYCIELSVPWLDWVYGACGGYIFTKLYYTIKDKNNG